jgi:serine/threonine protein kinase/tetratricopeptide (TPR) repeat protein
MDDPTNPLDPITSTAYVPPTRAAAAEPWVRQTNPTSDVTQESPDAPVVPIASGIGATSRAAFGRYAVRRSLGVGGFGEVYLGHDTLLDRPVAMKILRSGSTPLLGEGDPALQEARTLAHLRHPGIVAVYDVGVHEGQMYVVSDYLDGPDLGRWLRDNRPAWPEAVRIVAAVAAALSYAHARRIVHRDVKPANIIVTAGVVPVLVDFGLALGEEQAGGSAKGLVSGTPWYMSPEQAEGTAHRIDGRTDVYSLGVVLYEMLTGRVPFRSTTIAELIRQVRDDEPQPPRQLARDLPVDVERVCLKALAKQQQNRYTTAGDFAEDLQRVLQAAASPITPVRAPTPSAEVLSPMQTPMLARADVVPRTPLPVVVEGRTPSSVQRAREAERRQLTVLVCGCDFFESESYLELDSEDQADVLRAFLETCETAVQQFGGTIVQCSDKGMVACFGFPVAYEDAAGRAARTGFAILEGMRMPGDRRRLADRLHLDPWVGIHTGAAVVESKAAAVSLVGDARNVAVRLEDVAVAGQVICTEASHRLLQGRFQCASLGRQKIKSVPVPVELFRVEHVSVAGSPIDAVAPVELSPLTGRDQEVGLLKDRWDQAQEGMGQVVLLIGDPGLGKSRLVHTLKEHVLGQMLEGEVDSPVIEWRCSPHYQNTVLHPVIEFSEGALGFRPEEPPQDRIDRMLHRLEQYGLVRPETAPLWASLLSLPTPDRFPPLSLSPVRQREKTFRMLLEWLHTRAARRPILFIVEDLHWVDASTLEFLGQFLAEGLHDSILTLLTFRPEFKTPWPAVAHQTSLALNRLTRRQVGELIRKKTGSDMPEALVGQIYDRAGGVPLFVEEFTKMLQESGVPDTEWASSSGQTRLGREIPATLQDLMMVRLDRMEDERELAQLAATLGREFSHELLAAVATLDEPSLQGELAKLVQAEILYPKGRPPRCSYVFKHALLEDALYNALVKGKRQQFHRRIAEVLEAQFPQTAETQPELLARHFAEAGAGERAIRYWLKAGLRGLERSASVEAIGQLTKGLALVRASAESPERDAQELQFLNPLGIAYIATRGFAAPEVGPVFRRARELCERTGQPTQLLAIMWGTWAWHGVRGELRLCTHLAAEAVAFVAPLNDPGMTMEALYMRGCIMFYRGDFAGAREHCERATDYDDRERTKLWAAYTGQDSGVVHRSCLALALWHLGYADQAMTVDREVRQLARTIGHAFSTAHAVDFTACLYQFARLANEVEAAAGEEIAIATDQGFQLWRALGTLHKGAGLLLHSRHDEGLPLLLDGLNKFRGTGAELRVPGYLGMLGEAYAKLGRFEEAHGAISGALALAEKNDDRFQEAELHRLLGELHLAETEDQGAAEGCFRTAIETARRQQSRAWELRATMSLARLWQRQGRPDEAYDALDAVYATFTEGFTTPDLVDAKVLLESLVEPM